VSAAGVAVRIDGLSKSFGNRRVLDGVSLTIAPGELVALVGRSGCGKTTLLRILAGLDTPGAGRVMLGDAAAPVRMVFQDPRLLPWRTVADNVALGAGPGSLRSPEVHARVARALADVGLAGRERDWPAVLSGGQRQRVALARALISRPRLLLLDEPLAALDALTRLEMQALLERIWLGQGFSAVLVTHDVDEAVALADRVLVVEDGQVALELPVPLPRPRPRHGPQATALTDRLLARLLGPPKPTCAPAAESSYSPKRVNIAERHR
jgi:sulfonate transport system ATP-binding protein